MFKRWHSFAPDAKRYLIVQFFRAGFYTWPFWYGFSTERITPSQFGAYIAVTYAVSLLAEVPTGAFADTFGRKRSALIGVAIFSLYAPIVYFGGTFTAYIISAVVAGIGAAFTSGSLDSLLYESPDIDKNQFKRAVQAETIFWQAGLVLSTGLGGLFFSIYPVLPFVAQTASFVIAFSVILGMRTDKKVSSSKSHDPSITSFIAQNRVGFLHLFEKRLLLPIIIFGVMLSAVVWTGVEVLNEALMIQQGLDPTARGVLLAVTKLIVLTCLALFVYRRLKRDSDKLIYLFLMICVAGALFAVGSLPLFLLGFLLYNFVSSTLDAFIRPIIHSHVIDRYRATALSSFSFLTSLSVALSSLIVGVLLKQMPAVTAQRWFYGVMILLLIPTLILSLRSLHAKNW